MSLDYHFKILTVKTDEMLAKIAARVQGVEPNDFRGWGFSAPGMGVSVVSTKVASPQMMEWTVKRYEEGYGFFPNLRVSITQVRSIGYELSLQNIGKSVAALFQQTHEKAVFLFDYDVTIAQRLEEGGVVEVHQEGDEKTPDYYEWLAKALDEAGVRYVRKVLPSPLEL